MKPPGLTYFINVIGLYQLGGIMVIMLVGVDGFSQVPMSFVFNS